MDENGIEGPSGISVHRPLRLGDRHAAQWAALETAYAVIGEAERTLAAAGVVARWPALDATVRAAVLSGLSINITGGIPPGLVADRLSLARSTLSHHLAVLERDGLVRRGRRAWGDTRRVAVRLTGDGLLALGDAGTALADPRRDHQRATMRAVTGKWSDG